jgi:hypothetical protein
MNHSQPGAPPRASAWLLLLGFAVYWYSDTIADPDIWGHVRFGDDIVRTGSIAQPDVYSYRTAGQLWINHEWLSEVAFAQIYRAVGPSGLIGLKVAIGGFVVGVCLAHLQRRGMAAMQAVALLVVLSIPFRMGLGTVRPQIFTYALFLITCLIIERTTSPRDRLAWLLPAVFALWINLHGGVLAGVGVVGVWFLARGAVFLRLRRSAAGEARRELVSLGLLMIACGFALLVNPYRERLVWFLLTTGTVPRPEISEWNPLSLTSLPGILYLLLLAAGVGGLLGTGRPRRPDLVLLFGVTAVLAVASNRHYPLFAIVLVVFAGEHLADLANRIRPPATERGRWARPAFGASLIVCATLGALAVPRFGCIRIEPFYFPFPARAVALVGQSGVRGQMAVPFTWGEYVLWHLGPGVKVSIDGRRETIYSEESYRQAMDFERGTGDWNALLKTARTDLVLLEKSSPSVARMSRLADWFPLYQDTLCVLFVRNEPTAIERFTARPVPHLPDDGRGMCFPARSR